MTRRKATVAVASIAVGAGGFAAFADNAEAQDDVTVDEFSVADIEHESPDGMIEEITLTVDAEYAFETTTEFDSVEFELRVGRSEESLSEIAADSIDPTGTQDTGSLELSGPLSWAVDYEIADFRPNESGDTVHQDVACALKVALVRDGEELDTTRATTDARVTVTNAADVLELSVGGTGTFTIEE